MLNLSHTRGTEPDRGKPLLCGEFPNPKQLTEKPRVSRSQFYSEARSPWCSLVTVLSQMPPLVFSRTAKCRPPEGVMPFTHGPLEVSPERGQGSACPPGSSGDAGCGERAPRSRRSK